eukprot:m.35577 g.35577  ORF g.35577 m.35577 type:complete len:427 (-) comp12402_c0_seq2:41-1321(-)
MAQRIQRVAIIGSGAAGLAAAHRLQPSFTVDVFEAASVVGGTWHYTEECDIHGSMYRDLHTNLPKDIMAFPDFPWCIPSDRSFVHHTNVQAYLIAYSKHMQLDPLIRFNHRVTLLEKVADSSNESNPFSQWQLTALNTSTSVEMTQTYDAVVVCNGHYAKPYVPSIDNIGRFTGQTMHSHNYRMPEPFADKTVVILGGGQSGRDIAQEVCATARKVVLAHRAQAIGMPPLEETSSIVDVNDNGHLVTSDGQLLEADVLIYATGYHFDFPFLKLEQAGLSILPPKRIQGLYRHLLSIKEPSLAFIGIPIKIVPFPMFDLQARWLHHLWTHPETVPSPAAMIADEKADVDHRTQLGQREQQLHVMSTLQWEYNQQLAAEANTAPLADWRQAIYNDSNANKPGMPWTYKLNEYTLDQETGEWSKTPYLG